jgi:hypothetical protein
MFKLLCKENKFFDMFQIYFIEVNYTSHEN